MKLEIGQKAPDFCLPSQLGPEIRLSELRGKNVVLAFFPLAWTPIWTNQIPSYEAEMDSFTGLNAQVLGISVDHIPCLKAWADSLGGIHYPLLSDFWPHGAISELYGVMRSGEGHSERAIFVIDKQGFIRYIDIHNIDERPDNEVLRNVLRQIEADGAGKSGPEATRVAVKGDSFKSMGNYFGEMEEDEIPTGDIVLYCARWCKDCKKAKAWLDERGLAFVEVDIDYNMSARAQVRKWANGFLVTPVIDVGGTVVVDFDVPKLEEALRKRGLLGA